MTDIKKRKNMSELDLLQKFHELFPNHAQNLESYTRTGANILSIRLKNTDKSLVFLYNNEQNWTFGTKLYRRVPECYMKHLEAVRKKEKEVENKRVEVIKQMRKEEDSK